MPLLFMRYYITLVIITLVAISEPQPVAQPEAQPVAQPEAPKIEQEVTESKQPTVAVFQ